MCEIKNWAAAHLYTIRDAQNEIEVCRGGLVALQHLRHDHKIGGIFRTQWEVNGESRSEYDRNHDIPHKHHFGGKIKSVRKGVRIQIHKACGQ